MTKLGQGEPSEVRVYYPSLFLVLMFGLVWNGNCESFRDKSYDFDHQDVFSDPQRCFKDDTSDSVSAIGSGSRKYCLVV